jgi:hypothetical protein
VSLFITSQTSKFKELLSIPIEKNTLMSTSLIMNVTIKSHQHIQQTNKQNKKPEINSCLQLIKKKKKKKKKTLLLMGPFAVPD